MYPKLAPLFLFAIAHCAVGNAMEELIDFSFDTLASERVPESLVTSQNTHSPQNQIDHPLGWSIYPNLTAQHFPINVTIEQDGGLAISSGEPFVLTLNKSFTLLPQQRYEISCMVAGNGQFGLGFYSYNEGKHDYLLTVANLKSEQFQPVRFELEKNELSLAGASPRFHVKGNAKIKDLRLRVFDGLASASLVEGTVLETSKFPNPEQSDYADCLYTVKWSWTPLPMAILCLTLCN